MSTSSTALADDESTDKALVAQQLVDLINTRAQINNLFMEIRLKSTELTCLCTHYDSTFNMLNRHFPVFSPIRKLPPEILTKIFEFANVVVGQDEEKKEFPTLGANSMAVTVSQVCRGWRNVALGSSSLWCCFKILLEAYLFPHASYWSSGNPTNNFNNNDNAARNPVRFNSLDHERYLRHCDRVLSLVQMWVSRSGSGRGLEWELDARVIIDGFDSEGGDFDADEESLGLEFQVLKPAVTPLLNYLVEHSSRWKQVRLFLPVVCSDSVFNKVLEVSAVKTPLLEELHLTLDYTFFTRTPRPPPAVKTGLLMRPSKNFSVHLRLQPSVSPLADIAVNWGYVKSLMFSPRTQLQTLQGLQEWHSKCLLLLSLCAPSLEYCDFLMPRAFSQRQPQDPLPRLDNGRRPPRPHVLPKLKVLRMNRVAEVLLGFSECLEMPVLEELSLIGEYMDPEPREGDQSSMIEFTRRFGSTIRYATVHYIELTQNGLYECLKSLPNVTRLRLTGERGCSVAPHAELNAEAFDEMNKIGAGGVVMCPNLEHLYLRPGPRDDVFTQDALAKFVCVRRPAEGSTLQVGLTRLQTLMIKLHRDPSASKTSVKDALEMRRGSIGNLDGLMCVEEYVREMIVPSWEAFTEEKDLDF
ncbi:hypothetical protein MD484_g6046, partial [Candolleomyces efflorescens]